MNVKEFEQKVNARLQGTQGLTVSHCQVDVLSRISPSEMTAELLEHVVVGYALRCELDANLLMDIDWAKAAQAIDMQRYRPYQLFEQVTKQNA